MKKSCLISIMTMFLGLSVGCNFQKKATENPVVTDPAPEDTQSEEPCYEDARTEVQTDYCRFPEEEKKNTVKSY